MELETTGKEAFEALVRKGSDAILAYVADQAAAGSGVVDTAIDSIPLAAVVVKAVLAERAAPLPWIEESATLTKDAMDGLLRIGSALTHTHVHWHTPDPAPLPAEVGEARTNLLSMAKWDGYRDNSFPAALRDAAAPLSRWPKEAGWQPTHKHLKSDGLYREIARGRLEWNLAPAVIYDNAKGEVWVRPAAEFDDGRFEPLPPAPKEGE